MSSWIDSYYSISMNPRGQILYGATDEPEGTAIDTLSGDVSLTARAIKVTTTAISLSGLLNVSLKLEGIVGAELSLSSESSVSVTSIKISKSEAVIDSTSNTEVSVEKIAFAKISLSSSVNLDAKAYEILFAKPDALTSSADATAVALEILLAKSSISGFSINVIVGKEILLAKIIIASKIGIRKIPAIRFSPNLVEDTQDIRPLLIVNGSPLSEHNRRLGVNIIQSFIQNTNWSARRSRYYKTNSARKSFSISWSQLPNSRSMTADEKHGRDFIQNLASDPRVHSLKLRNIDSDGISPYSEEEYNVVVKNYTESLTRRDLVGETYYWDCSLELEEV